MAQTTQEIRKMWLDWALRDRTSFVEIARTMVDVPMVALEPVEQPAVSDALGMPTIKD